MFSSIGIPHGFCYLWNPWLLSLHVGSDLVIALAYFLIPFALLNIVRRRRDIPYNSILLCFGLFIVACGATHVMEVITLWHPVYWLSGGLKAFTAIVSTITFFILLRLTPAILSIPTHDALEAANRQLVSVMESTTVGMFAVDSNWKMSYINGKAQAVFGKDTKVIGKLMWDVLPYQSDYKKKRLREVMETRTGAEFESYYPPLDLTMRVTAHPWASGGITVFLSDVSTERRLQRELEQATALREQRIGALAQMAAGLAHEISNPLGIIHARASDLLEMAEEGETPTADEVEAACESIVKTTERATRILRGLRMFAREGAHDAMSWTSLTPLVEQTVALVQQRFQTHGIALTVNIDATIAPIPCRETQIGQIVFNLLNNAFDAIDTTHEGSRWVRLDVRRKTDSPAEEIVIDVIDSGPGVAEEHKPHLMQPFFTTKSAGGGMGVGLSLSRAIARDHGGDLALTEVDGHTCFRLTLPALLKVEEVTA